MATIQRKIVQLNVMDISKKRAECPVSSQSDQSGPIWSLANEVRAWYSVRSDYVGKVTGSLKVRRKSYHITLFMRVGSSDNILTSVNFKLHWLVSLLNELWLIYCVSLAIKEMKLAFRSSSSSSSNHLWEWASRE